jgi:hypothetical protein
MSESITIEQLIQVIERLPADAPVDDPQKWYTTQKEHWLGWLNEYHAPGAYSRQTNQTRDARYVYNHIVEPKMLIWLIEAVKIDIEIVNAAKNVATSPLLLQQKSAATRRIVPWKIVVVALKRLSHE